jgi:hypothetical protein
MSKRYHTRFTVPPILSSMFGLAEERMILTDLKTKAVEQLDRPKSMSRPEAQKILHARLRKRVGQ